MRALVCLSWITTIGLVVSPACGQQALLTPDQMRLQIEILQRQLQMQENQDSSDSRVTQLGAKRVVHQEPQMTVRIYDLSDLFATAPAYPATYSGGLLTGSQPAFPYHGGGASGAAASGGFGGGGGFFAVPSVKPPGDRQHTLAQVSHGSGAASADSRASMDNLIEAVTSTISPTMWDEVGGPYSIAQLGYALLISADRQTHEQLDDLLALFRKKWGSLRTISVRGWWLWLNDEQLARLLPDDGLQPVGDKRVYGAVDEAAWKKQLAEPKAEGTRGGYRAIVTCYNGQTVSTHSGGQTLAISQFEPTILSGEGEDSPERVVYRPQTTVLHEGATLQVMPLANTTGKYVVLDVHSRIDKLRERAAIKPADNKPADNQRGDKAGALSALEQAAALIDRSQLLSSELATTLRVPVDRTMLVGGMSFDVEPMPGDPSLYLFMRVSVQELRDDLPVAPAAAAVPAPAARPAPAPAAQPAAKKP